MHTTTISRTLRTLAAVAALPLFITACSAADETANTSETSEAAEQTEITLVDGWAKAAEGMSGVFGTLVNPTDEAVTLVGAESERAGLVELHETAIVDGQSVMREIDGGFTIPAEGTHELIPGEDHIMLMEMETELLPGEVFPITLLFDDGTEVSLELDVREYAGANEDYGDLEHGDHEDHEGHGDQHE